MVDFDQASARAVMREGMTDEEWARAKAAEPGGGGGPNSKYFSGAKKNGFHLLGTDLFGEEVKADATGKLRERFDFPPFSVLNAREGPWQERKRAWLSLGIQSEVGRGENLLKMSDTLLEPDPEKRAVMQAGRGEARTFGSGGPSDLAAGFKRVETASLSGGLNLGVTADAYRKAGEEVEGAGGTGTSIFDPVLTELCYRWFAPPGGLILDPFAGGSVRGLVAGLLGYRYHGLELRPEQVTANEAQKTQIAPEADITWVVGDSNVTLKDAPEADFVFSCPPYFDLEQYSDDPADLSAVSWDQFVGIYRSIIRKAVERLRPDRFACFVVGEVRDKETGLYRGFVPLTTASFMAAGAAFYNEAVLVTSVGSLPIRVTKQFDTSRKLGRTHQNITIHVKGDPRRAAAACLGAPQAAPARPRAQAPLAAAGLETGQACPEAGPFPPDPAPMAAEAPSALAFALAAPAAPAPPVADSVPASEVRATTGTLAEFLGATATRADASWVPDEPPDLSGVDEVVLNFAADGLDWVRGARPVGLTVSTMDGRLCRFLPFGFRGGGNLDEAAVKRWAERELRGKKVTNSKTKFDVHMSREWGVDLEAQGCTFSDIQHTAALLDDHRKRFKIDVLAEDYLPGLRKVARVDESRHADYNASEVAERERHTAELVWRLRDAMYPELDRQELRAVQALEDAVIPAVVEMERNGSPIDIEMLERFGKECTAKRDALLWEVSRECGFAFEHTAAGWKRLLESLHLAVPDSFKEAELDEVDHPLVRKGQRASQFASLNSKIFKAYPEHVVDGVLRYDINQLASDEGGTVSGRFSIGLVQQVPNHDNHHSAFGDDPGDAAIKACGGLCDLFPRRLFVPGSGDYLEGDAAQIEFRLLVHYSQNSRLLRAYRDDPWMSFHRKMQELLVAYKPDMLYAHTKNYNFAAQYGARSIKLAVMMGFITAREGDEIRAARRWDDPRLKLIHEIEAAYKRSHPEAGALLDRASHLMKNECDDYCKRGDALHRQFQHRGYVKTMLGRRSRCVGNYKPYIGLNRVLQGTGASIMKKKLTELHAVRRETGFVMRITNHDAVLGDATTPETLEKVREVLNRQSFDLTVPILWSVGTGRSWAECK